LPHHLPKSHIVIIFFFFAISIAFITFFEFPLVDIQTKISPSFHSPSTCLANISSNQKSFHTAVKILVSVVSAIAGRACLFILYLPINSAAQCCASAADHQFPAINNLFQFFKAFIIAFITSSKICSFS
jgi:hypothetical protein